MTDRYLYQATALRSGIESHSVDASHGVDVVLARIYVWQDTIVYRYDCSRGNALKFSDQDFKHVDCQQKCSKGHACAEQLFSRDDPAPKPLIVNTGKRIPDNLYRQASVGPRIIAMPEWAKSDKTGLWEIVPDPGAVSECDWAERDRTLTTNAKAYCTLPCHTIDGTTYHNLTSTRAALVPAAAAVEVLNIFHLAGSWLIDTGCPHDLPHRQR
jgi:hypothetical protein